MMKRLPAGRCRTVSIQTGRQSLPQRRRMNDLAVFVQMFGRVKKAAARVLAAGRQDKKALTRGPVDIPNSANKPGQLSSLYDIV